MEFSEDEEKSWDKVLGDTKSPAAKERWKKVTKGSGKPYTKGQTDRPSSESYVHAAIQAAKEENPNDMQDLIGQALNDKITDAINLKKVSLAGEFFNPQDGEIAVEEDKD